MSFRIGQKLPEKLEDIDGVVKSAILLLSLDETSASNLLRCLPQDVVQGVHSVHSPGLHGVGEVVGNAVGKGVGYGVGYNVGNGVG